MKEAFVNFWDVMKRQLFELIPVVATFFAPATGIGAIVFILLVVDTYQGIKTARHLKEKLTTNRFSDLFAKIIGYAVFLSIGLLVQTHFEFKYGVLFASILPIYTELASIDENQKKRGLKGIITQAEEVYKFALRIKKKRDALRGGSSDDK